jgi:Velvet factor
MASYNMPLPQDPAPSSPLDDSYDQTDHSNDPTPLPETRIYDGKIWALDVVQQPIRARMCGFGDKDRRPITPPPCIRLIVMDANTKQEVDINSLDTAFFVLTVDLWNVEATKEVNLVAHIPSNAPAIGQVIPASFPHTVSNPSPNQPSPRPFHDLAKVPAYSRPAQNFGSPIDSANSYYPPSNGFSAYNNSVSSPFPSQSGYQYQDHRNSYPDYRGGHSGQHPNGYPQHDSSSSFSSQGAGQGFQYNASSRHDTPVIANDPRGAFTRNLIGSLSASAFKLNDMNDVFGIWFVLQDLSIRTEGWFRLKLNFVNVGQPTTSAQPTSAVNGQVSQTVTKTTAPVLASIFSKPFRVYSAKKFPGVIDSTDLSKLFANQGIKIPIRKDPVAIGGKRKAGESPENEEDDS